VRTEECWCVVVFVAAIGRLKSCGWWGKEAL
jgi:hypothetical protein